MILNSSHCTGNMYHIINAQVNNVTVPYACWLLWRAYYIVNNVTKFLHFWIDVLDEPTIQLKRWNLRALENETHMKALILNTACHSPRTGSPSSLSLSSLTDRSIGQCERDSSGGAVLVHWALCTPINRRKTHWRPLLYDRGKPAVSYKWTGWVCEITGWSARRQENYWSF